MPDGMPPPTNHPPGDVQAAPFTLLYGQHGVQVRVWNLTESDKGRTYALGPGEYFILNGEVTVQSNSLKERFGARKRFSLPERGDYNMLLHTDSLEMLEILWPAQASDWQNKPLQEITEERPWGSFTVLSDEPHYKLKQLRVKPGNRLSLQRHQQREEHWFIVQGKPSITVNEDTERHQPQDYVFIPLHAWHRIANSGSEDVELIELQLGDYFGEDDIERREDDYGRN